MKRFSSWIGRAVLLSLALHAVLLPFVRLPRASAAPPTGPEIASIDPPHVASRTTPRPTPTPRPVVRRTPSPIAPPASPRTAIPIRAPRRPVVPPRPVSRVRPPRIVPHAGSAVAVGRDTPRAATGGPTGEAGGSGDRAPGPGDGASSTAPAAPASAATEPPVVATPKPSCARPDADATVAGRPAEPVYPESARRAGAVGSVAVLLRLDAAGTVVAATVNRSSGYVDLDAAALDAARATAYVPAVVACAKTGGSYLFRVDFSGE